MLIQGFNYLFGSFFNHKRTYISQSLCYLKRKREIDRNYLDHIRLSSLELAAHEINTANLPGSVAELGVYKGKFSRYINQYFPERNLYLFDTFTGFNAKDVSTETSKGYSSGEQDFSDTSIQAVLNIMPHPEKCIIKKGYFPETAEGLNETFALVSIDTDLYDPIYNGLCYFFPRMTKGGFIFVHDYNNDEYKGAKKAVRQFCMENNIHFFPLPDSCGSAIIMK
jgi:O-methyltransferase